MRVARYASVTSGSSERDLYSLLDAMREFVLILDTDGRCRGCSAVALNYLRTDADEVRGKELHHFLPHDIAELLIGAVRCARESAERVESSFTLQLQDSRYHFDAEVTQAGERTVIIARELVAGVFTPEAPALFEQEFSVLGTPIVVFKWSAPPNYRVLYVSPSVRRFGYSPDDFVSGRVSYVGRFIHPEDRERVTRETQTGRERRGELALYEYRVVCSDGSVRWVLDFSRAFYEDPRISAVGLLVDITERKEAELGREHLFHELEEKAAELERYNYTTTHDLRVPLVTIQGFAEMLQEEAATGDISNAGEYASRIVKAAHRMGSLLDDLLEFSRVGRTRLVRKRHPLWAILTEVLHTSEVKASRRGVRIYVEPTLLDERSSPVVYGDFNRLVEVFQNLIDNAVKYMGDEAQPHVDIGVAYRKGGCTFFVRDNGIGVEPRFLERIFGLFEKVNPRSEGTGIGLAIVKRIVDLHGGRIWAESEGSGTGTTFYVALPLAAEGTRCG